MQLSQLAPNKNQRLAVFGKTDSGKTYLTARIYKFYKNCIVADPKWSPSLIKETKDSFRLVYGLKELYKARESRVIYRPTKAEYQNRDAIEEFYGFIFDREETMCGTDEMYLMSEEHWCPSNFRACMAQGREKNIGMINCSQRPSYIPKTMVTESELFISFKLVDEADCDRVARLLTVDPYEIFDLQLHDFIVATASNEVYGPMRLVSENQNPPSLTVQKSSKLYIVR